MKYIIRVNEILSKAFVVEGKNEAEALRKIQEAYDFGEINLSYRDFFAHEITCENIAEKLDEQIYSVWEE